MPAASPKTPSLWRNRDYLILWSGQTVSALGGNVSGIAFPLLILALTGAPLQAGLAGSMAALTHALASLPAGVLVDRWDRKRIMILSDTGRALALGSIPCAVWLGHLSLPQVYAAAAVEGFLSAFFTLAASAAFVQVVPQARLAAAASSAQASLNVSTLLGPGLGGWLYGMARPLPFLIDTVTYAVSVFSVLFIEAPQHAAPTRNDLRQEIREGLSWLRAHALIRFIAVLGSGYTAVFAASYLALIVFARDLHASAATIGLIFSVGSIGRIAGSLLGAVVGKRYSLGGVTIAVGWLQVLLWPLYLEASTPLALAVITAAISGLGAIYAIMAFSYRAVLIPASLRGRVNSAFELFTAGGSLLGPILSGVLLQWIGARSTLLALLLALVALAAASSVSQRLRGLPRLGELPIA